jgi:predicted nucleic acid-binding protein
MPARSLIIFARIGGPSLLRDFAGSLLIADAVYDEIVVEKGGMPGAADVTQAAWVQKASVANRSIIHGLPSVLHEGEREAITFAKERPAQLLIDEIRARRAACDLGIEVIGTLRILSEAIGTHRSRSPDHCPDAIMRIPTRSSFDSTVPREDRRSLAVAVRASSWRFNRSVPREPRGNVNRILNAICASRPPRRSL